jgi:hypothetical protein
MLKIIKATFGSLDVTDKLNDLICENKLFIFVNNSIFGVPDVGIIKQLKVIYCLDDKENSEISIYENGVIAIPPSTSNRLGIFYTNNKINKQVLSNSLSSIYKSSKKYSVDILTSTWEPIHENPFHELNCSIRTHNHFNIAYQINQLLQTAKLIKNYKYVSFLEHDVLYGEDYFNYNDFDCDIYSNQNFIGMNENGYQKKIQNDEPLHQLTLNFNYALEHFKNILCESIIQGVNLEPSYTSSYTKYNSIQPSIHINHGNHFTSHFNIYSKDNYQNDEYWGNHNLINPLKFK